MIKTGTCSLCFMRLLLQGGCIYESVREEGATRGVEPITAAATVYFSFFDVERERS